MFNPGMNAYQAGSTTSLLSLLKKINFTSVLNTTQKTLNIANQAIPLINQVKPLVNNAKTMFKIIGAVKSDNTSSHNKMYNQTSSIKTNNVENYNQNQTSYYNYNNAPIFFI